MARSLGIPARVAVGYTPGLDQGDGTRSHFFWGPSTGSSRSYGGSSRSSGSSSRGSSSSGGHSISRGGFGSGGSSAS